MLHRKKLTEEEKQAQKSIKAGMKLYLADAMTTMSHTQACPECETKFNQITEHGGGGMKSITHIPSCPSCQSLFQEIVKHTKETKMEKS